MYYGPASGARQSEERQRFSGPLFHSEAACHPYPQMVTAIPPEITTSNMVKMRLGTLTFFDGFPDDATVERVYDNLDRVQTVPGKGWNVILRLVRPARTMVRQNLAAGGD